MILVVPTGESYAADTPMYDMTLIIVPFNFTCNLVGSHLQPDFKYDGIWPLHWKTEEEMTDSKRLSIDFSIETAHGLLQPQWCSWPLAYVDLTVVPTRSNITCQISYR